VPTALAWKVRSKVVPGFARGLVDDVIKLPAGDVEMRLRMGQLNEVGILQDAASFLHHCFWVLHMKQTEGTHDTIEASLVVVEEKRVKQGKPKKKG